MKKEQLDIIKQFLSGYDGPPVKLMEVCGTHTAQIVRNGIPSMLSDRIRLISGPGCPVCVTVTAYIDRLVELAFKEDTIVYAFGDLLRVRGSRYSLSDAKAQGARVKMVYSPMEMIQAAQEDGSRTHVFAAVGFETTTPVYAVMLEEAIEKKLTNVRLLTSLKTMPEVIRWLCEEDLRTMRSLKEQGKTPDEEGGAYQPVTGFIAPGHVCAVTGSGIFEDLAREYGLPFIVSGFSGEELLLTIYGLVKNQGKGIVRNFYPSVVTRDGNTDAEKAVDRFFAPCDAAWRGMGVIPGSGLVLRPEFAAFDAGSEDLLEDRLSGGCRCADVLTGRISPSQCPLFGKVCTPSDPHGACMVSQEGSCFNSYNYRHH